MYISDTFPDPLSMTSKQADYFSPGYINVLKFSCFLFSSTFLFIRIISCLLLFWFYFCFSSVLHVFYLRSIVEHVLQLILLTHDTLFPVDSVTMGYDRRDQCRSLPLSAGTEYLPSQLEEYTLHLKTK